MVNNSSILFVRPDAIGDAVLAASMLEPIKKKFHEQSFIVACQQHLEPLYKASPFVDEVIGFDKKKFVEDAAYQNNILANLRSKNIACVLNSVYSRELSMEPLVHQVGAEKRIGFRILQRRGRYDFLFRYNRGGYTQLITSADRLKLELDRHRDFLSGIGITREKLMPQLWLSDDDEMFAQNFFDTHKLVNKKVIILFAGCLSAYRVYTSYGKALQQFVNNQPDEFAVIALGGKNDTEINEANLQDLCVPTFNLCGKTTLLQAAALIKHSSLAIGAETGLAHIACAVKTKHVIILGGGHFGRFMPYTPLTTAVCLPLACYGCNWRCKYNKAHCVSDIDYRLLIHALHETSDNIATRPRVFVSKQKTKLYDSWTQPQWDGMPFLSQCNNVDIIVSDY